jgi:hypothetical protein
MGAWGRLFDQNDDAADWLGDFADSPSWAVVSQAFNAVDAEYVEASDASQALAAAEVVAAALGSPSDRLSRAIADWASRNAAEGEAHQDSARATLMRVRDDSEVQELWQESDEYTDWKTSVDETLSRLG